MQCCGFGRYDKIKTDIVVFKPETKTLCNNFMKFIIKISFTHVINCAK